MIVLFFPWRIKMTITRRKFIKETLFAGSSLLLTPSFLHALQKTENVFPAYGKLENEGKLRQRVEEAYSVFDECRLCPRECGVNRNKGEKGFCQASARVKVYTAHPHYGEEVSLVGKRGGSGTIFFSNCNLRCVFCQNWSIAHLGYGEEVDDKDLANIMLSLQKKSVITSIWSRPHM